MAARPAAQLQQAGSALYHGELALTGRIVGHDLDLPAQASRCINCHGAAVAASAPPLAPLLNAASLTRLTPRRGGPPSRYDTASMCALLRSGVDPAHVMIPRTMPRYTITDADCKALWAFLSTR